ncbi:hypothetical protein CF327_g5336 [Tilletia walkeri]|nr:hypothetical protein CF327_g5336 [Tilletia walkeri]
MPVTRSSRQKQQHTAADPTPTSLSDTSQRKTRTRTKSQNSKTAEPANSETPSEEPAPSSDQTHDVAGTVANETTREEDSEAQSSMCLINLDSDQPEQHDLEADDDSALRNEQQDTAHEAAAVTAANEDRSETVSPIVIDQEGPAAVPTAEAAMIDTAEQDEVATLPTADDAAVEGANSSTEAVSETASPEAASPVSSEQPIGSSDTTATQIGMLVDFDESVRNAPQENTSQEQTEEIADEPASEDQDNGPVDVPTPDNSVPLITLDSSPVKNIRTPSLMPAGKKDEELAQRDEQISKLTAQLKRKEVEVQTSRTYLRRFANTLSSTLTGDSAPPDSHGNAARTSGVFGRASLGIGANTSLTGLHDGDQSLMLGDSSVCTIGPSYGEREFGLDIVDDVDSLRVLWTEATQRFDFLRLEDHLLIQRLQKDLESVQSVRSDVKTPAPSPSVDPAVVEELKKVQEQLEDAQRKASELAEEYEEKLRSQRAAMEEIKGSFKGRQSDADQLRAKLAAAEGRVEQVKKEQDRLLDEERSASGMLLQATSKELDKLKERNTQLEQALNQARTDAAQAAELRTELERAGANEAQAQQLQEELVAAEEQLKVMGDEKEEELQRFNEERKAFAEQLNTASTQQDELTTQTVKLEAELELTRKELDSARQSEEVIQQLRDELSSQKEIATQLETEREKQAQLILEERAASAKMLSDADGERDALSSRIVSLEESLQRAQTEAGRVSELQAQLDRSEQTTNAQVHEHVERLRQEQGKVHHLEEELKHKEVELIRLRTQVVANDELVKQAKEDSDRINDRLHAAKHERDALHRQLVDMEELVTQSSKSSASSKETSDKLQGRIQDLEASLESNRREVEQVEDLKAQNTRLEEELARRVEEIEENDTKMLTSLKERKRLEARCKKLQAKVDQMVAGPSSAPEAIRSASTPSVPAQVPQTSSSESTGDRVGALRSASESSGDRAATVRSPLTVSKSANVPLAQQSVVRSARVIEAAPPSVVQKTTVPSREVSQPSVREAKPPTPWSVAVALSSGQASRPASSESTKPKPSRPSHEAVSSRPPSSTEKSRKRSSPDDDAEAVGVFGGNSAAVVRDAAGASLGQAPVTRAIYVPSPHRASGFVPQRRSKMDLGASTREGAGPSSSASTTPSSSAAPASSTIRLVGKSNSTKLSAAERLAGRLAGTGDGPALTRLVGGGGAGRAVVPLSGGGTGLSAQLAEVRARRAISTMQPSRS